MLLKVFKLLCTLKHSFIVSIVCLVLWQYLQGTSSDRGLGVLWRVQPYISGGPVCSGRSGQEHTRCYQDEEREIHFRRGWNKAHSNCGTVHHNEPRLCWTHRATWKPKGPFQVENHTFALHALMHLLYSIHYIHVHWTLNIDHMTPLCFCSCCRNPLLCVLVL